jgi:hypothetical protein
VETLRLTGALPPANPTFLLTMLLVCKLGGKFQAHGRRLLQKIWGQKTLLLGIV